MAFTHDGMQSNHVTRMGDGTLIVMDQMDPSVYDLPLPRDVPLHAIGQFISKPDLIVSGSEVKGSIACSDRSHRRA